MLNYRGLVLSACTPAGSAAYRYVVFAEFSAVGKPTAAGVPYKGPVRRSSSSSSPPCGRRRGCGCARAVRSGCRGDPDRHGRARLPDLADAERRAGQAPRSGLVHRSGRRQDRRAQLPPLRSGRRRVHDADEITQKTWTVTFQDGKTYNYVCDVHLSTMKGNFTVGTCRSRRRRPSSSPTSARASHLARHRRREADGQGRRRQVRRDREGQVEDRLVPPERPRRQQEDRQGVRRLGLLGGHPEGGQHLQVLVGRPPGLKGTLKTS